MRQERPPVPLYPGNSGSHTHFSSILIRSHSFSPQFLLAIEGGGELHSLFFFFFSFFFFFFVLYYTLDFLSCSDITNTNSIMVEQSMTSGPISSTEVRNYPYVHLVVHV